MADSTKVRWSQLKVGLLALAAIAIAATLIFLLTSTKGLFKPYALLRTYMEDASAMSNGTAVRLNGITVGYVDQFKLTNSTDPKRAVEIDMMVEQKYLDDIPVDSVAGVSAANLLGDKFINITKGQAPQHAKDGDQIRSLQAQDIPELMAQSANILQSFQVIVGRVDKLLAGVEEGKGNIGKLLKDEELYNRLNGIVSEVDAMLADLQSGQGTAGKLLRDPELFDQARQSLMELRGLLADVNAGKGTAGKLLKDDQVYQRVDDLLAKFNTTIDKINSGQGTLGQLVANPQLYDALNGATREFQGLAKDIRSNPKKFLRIKLALF